MLVFRKKLLGVSLVEVIVAIAVFSILATALVGLISNVYLTEVQAGQQSLAQIYAEEGIEAARSIRRRAWNLLENGSHGLTNTNGYWEWSGTQDILGDYTRTVTVEDVYRDINGDIVETGGQLDLHTKKITSRVEWQVLAGFTNNVTLTAYLTNWQSKDWIQTDWSGGPGQEIWSDPSRYWTDDGNIDYTTAGVIKLASNPSINISNEWPFDVPANYSYDTNKIEVVSSFAQLKELTGTDTGQTQNPDFSSVTTGSYNWPFDNPSNYIYDSQKIEVTGGYAQLKQVTTMESGGTVNPDFSSGLSPWTANDWDQDASEPNVTEERRNTGGNPGAYVRVNFPRTTAQYQMGGYFEQSFTTTVDNPDTATLNFDWKVITFRKGQPDVFRMYAFVDSSPGEPVIGTQVWDSGQITGTTSWLSAPTIDVTLNLPTAGTYYLKVAVWIEKNSTANQGPYRAGFDNVQLNWSKAVTGYPTDLPTIRPISSYTQSTVNQWTGFTEIANKNGGEIYYQLSDDDGATWYWWDGGSWSVAGVSDYNTADVINANISSFNAESKQITWQAFLASDGSQLVQLDNVQIDYLQIDYWSYYDWQYDLGDSDPSGNWYSTGGNPDAYIDIYIPRGNGSQVGGFWQQEFTTSFNNPDSATLTFDATVLQFPDTPDYFRVFAFIDTTPGEPVVGTEVWNSGLISGTIPWTTINVDVTSALANAGTYYLKLAVGLVQGTSDRGPYQVGFDNVQTSWSKALSGYPDDGPTIEPISSYQPSEVSFWTAFTEVANKNGGEIYYQLSDDDGATWYWWDGGAWSPAINPTDYNTATEVNTNIADFPVDNKKFLFKAFLVGDGTQQVQLDTVTIEGSTLSLTIEAGQVTVDHNWQTVNTQIVYSNPVIIASYYESANTIPATVRVRNVSQNSFEIRLQNPAGQNLNPDVVNYLVIEEGTWDIGNAIIEAHRYDTATVASKGNWVGDALTYDNTFTNDPIVLHQLMSDNDPAWITTWVSRTGSRSNPPDTSGFQIALNCAEACSSHGAVETIGWVAIEMNIIDTVEGINFETQRTTDSVRGHDNGCYNFSFNQSYSGTPIIISSQLEMDGRDGGWNVICNQTNTQVGFHSEEDQVDDDERGHTTETHGFIAFAQSFSVDGGAGGASYPAMGWFESSAFNSGSPSSFNIISWSEILPSINEDIRVQIATAPDAGGSPGVWSAWTGLTGPGTYYDDPQETLIPLVSGHNDDQWVKYRVELLGNGSDTPILDEIKINYTP